MADPIHIREGLECSEGVIDGRLYCSTVPASAPLGPVTWPTDRIQTVYVAAVVDCP